jgi:hypothetical protein
MDVIVASYVLPVVKPPKTFVPEVLPGSVVGVLVVRSFNVMVLDVACGSGVNVTVIEVEVVWLILGAAGVAN